MCTYVYMCICAHRCRQLELQFLYSSLDFHTYAASAQHVDYILNVCSCERKANPIGTHIPFVLYMLRKAAWQMRPRQECAISSNSLTFRNNCEFSNALLARSQERAYNALASVERLAKL